MRVGIAAFVAIMLAASVCDADPAREAQRVHWDPAWSHSNAWDYTLTAFATTVVAVHAHAPSSMVVPMPIAFDRGAGAGAVAVAVF